MSLTEDHSFARHYAKIWNLTNLERVLEGPNSIFYSCASGYGPYCLLKILTPQGAVTEGGGFELLSSYDPADAGRIFEFDQNAALLEYLDGPRLLDHMDDGFADNALDIQIDLAFRLLDSPIRPRPQRSILDLLQLNKDTVVPDWAAETIRIATNISRRVLWDMSDWCALHSDIHPRNIIHDGSKWRVIDAQAIHGPPAFEFTQMFINPWDRPDLIFEKDRMATISRRVAQGLGAPEETVLQCAIANALIHARQQFEFGRGRHPIKCIIQMVGLLQAFQN